jgi:hypothetical protein
MINRSLRRSSRFRRKFRFYPLHSDGAPGRRTRQLMRRSRLVRPLVARELLERNAWHGGRESLVGFLVDRLVRRELVDVVAVRQERHAASDSVEVLVHPVADLEPLVWLHIHGDADGVLSPVLCEQQPVLELVDRGELVSNRCPLRRLLGELEDPHVWVGRVLAVVLRMVRDAGVDQRACRAG